MKSLLIRKLRKNDTEERCGFIVDGRVIELKNVASDKTKSFEISPEDTIKYEKTFTAIWHTHPYESSNLSDYDYISFLMWPKVSHYIIGTDGVSKYVVEDGLIINED